ncbi:MAG: Rpn family recombination-promoting nuclease/putative transposase [Algicola sp.]|nr:Rpn family recombination-promoting nuclease/putative transposase [Algicola sp.]
MKHYINPTIDFVFKILFGSLENIDLLLDFLNRTLQPANPIETIQILNPYNEREFETDKLSIVDVRVVDEKGYNYQVEVQIGSPHFLHKRIMYMWSRQYQSQMTKGVKFAALRPVVSIWILTEDVMLDSLLYHHHIQAVDEYTGKLFTDQMSIHLLELDKWHEPDKLQTSDYWPFFFKDAKNWKQLPKKLDTPKMRQAMKVLKQISDKQAEYYRYQAREDYLRLQESLMDDLEQERVKSKQKSVRFEQERIKFEQERVESKQEKARLVAIIREAGIDPNK